MGSLVAYISGHVIYNVTPSSVYEITQEKPSLYAHALFFLAEPHLVTIEGFMAPMTYSLFKVIEEQKEKLYDDLRHGTVSGEVGIPSQLRAEMQRHMKVAVIIIIRKLIRITITISAEFKPLN